MRPSAAKLVRERWRFDGLIVSDHGAIRELLAHGVAGDTAEAAALALRAGVDIDLMSGAYGRGLPLALERGLVTVAQIDAAVRRVLGSRPGSACSTTPIIVATPRWRRPARRRCIATWRDAARRSIVLLTNRDGLLPLQDAKRRIAVIGPLADARDDMLGPLGGRPRRGHGHDPRGPARGAARKRDQPRAGRRDRRRRGGIGAALDLARAADVVLCLGEARRMSGEAASRARPDLPGHQPELAQAVLDLGKPVVVLVVGSPPHGAVAVRARAGRARDLVSRQRGGPRHRRRREWPIQPFGPAARLRPVDVGQIPIFYARRPSGRPADPEVHYSSKYLDLPVDPLFPFGHGLSYSRFVPRDLRVSATEPLPDRNCRSKSRSPMRSEDRRGHDVHVHP